MKIEKCGKLVFFLKNVFDWIEKCMLLKRRNSGSKPRSNMFSPRVDEETSSSLVTGLKLKQNRSSSLSSSLSNQPGGPGGGGVVFALLISQ